MADPRWREAVAAADFHDATVVHLAARVHEPDGPASDFERDDVEKTRVLAEAAAAGGATASCSRAPSRFMARKPAGNPSGPIRPQRQTDSYGA